MHVRHELLPGDFARGLRFSVWFNERRRLETFLDSFLIGDEASFVMNGEVNTQNVRQYVCFPQLAENFNNQYWEGMFRGIW